MTVDERFSRRMTKERDAEILRSVLTCFSEHGCFDTKVGQVVDDVGISKGTLYRHYGSRESLLDAAFQSGVQALLARCQDIWSTSAVSPEGALCAVIGEMLALNRRRDPVSPGALSRLGCSCRWSKSSHADAQDIEAALVPLAVTWQAAGLFDEAIEPKWIIAVTIALVNSSAVDREASDIDDVLNGTVAVLNGAFSPGSAPRLR